MTPTNKVKSTKTSIENCIVLLDSLGYKQAVFLVPKFIILKTRRNILNSLGFKKLEFQKYNSKIKILILKM